MILDNARTHAVFCCYWDEMATKGSMIAAQKKPIPLKDVLDQRRENGFVVAEKLSCGCWLDLKALGLKPGKMRRRCPTHHPRS